MSPYAPPPSGGGSSTRHDGEFPGHLHEIEAAFQIFDSTLEGYVDVPTFEVMVHAFGFRVTRDEIETLCKEMQQEQQNGNQTDSFGERGRVSLSMAVQIMERIGYRGTNTTQLENRMRSYFQTFDGGKGYITFEDLKRVQQDVKDAERRMSPSLDSGSVVGDELLQAMIAQFDENGDGVLHYHEFTKILAPLMGRK